MFDKQPLLDSKRKIICSAVELINSQSKALQELLQLMIVERNAILADKKKFKELNQHDEDAFMKRLYTLMDIELYASKEIIHGFTDNFNEFRKSILLGNNSRDIEYKHLLDPFDSLFLPDDVVKNNSALHTFFKSNEHYKQTIATRDIFEDNIKTHQNMIQLRQYAAGAVVCGLYFIGVLAAFGICMAVSLFASPMGGGALFGLFTAAHIFYLCRIFDDIEKVQNYFISIDENVNLLSSVDGGKQISEDPFAELDELQANKEALIQQSSMF